MIKGRYVAQIEADFKTQDTNISLQELKGRLHGDWIDNNIMNLLSEMFDSGDFKAVVTVTKTYADVYETEGGGDSK